MTDNEIIKALKCCSETTGSECSECPLLNADCSAYDLYKLALDLINRQNAKIEKLEKIRAKQANIIGEERGQKYELLNKICKAKSEAREEFVKKLKEKLQWDVEFDNKLVFESDIDNLVKEMAEMSE